MRTDGRETGLARVPAALLRAAEQNFLDAIRVFDDLITRLIDGAPLSSREIYKSAQAFHVATKTFFELRRAIDDRMDPEDPADDENGLDLEDARDRVRRLLDRLRPEGDKDAVP